MWLLNLVRLSLGKPVKLVQNNFTQSILEALALSLFLVYHKLEDTVSVCHYVFYNFSLFCLHERY